MNNINWSNFDSTDFTLFCNALLTFEIGNDFIPFSAPGKDGGVDGKYIGEYDNGSGSWRFQYKFHQVARKQAYNSLKSQLKSEILNLKNENFFVLITNIELLPQERKELEDLFSDKTSNFLERIVFKIWDGAKLFALCVKYPLLELWLNEGFKTAQLQDYRDFFKKEMHLKEFEPGTLTNIFISRERDIDLLKEFIIDNSVLALIVGEAGIGKTRLVVEFFEKYIKQTKNWIALVLASKNIQFDILKKALSLDRNIIILIDDAHSYSSETISDLKRLAQAFEGKIKLILTARTLQANDSLRLIKEYEQEEFLKIELGNLEREETKQIFDSYLSESPYRHYINYLIELSYGRPILIVAILKAINENIPISRIREGGFLKDYVVKYFDSFYTTVGSQTEMSKLKLKRLLQNIALIEPFNYENSEIITELSTIHDIGIPEINLALKTLVDFSFVSGRFEQSIKPDFYSDILLLDINKDDASDYISQFNTLLDNIIFNLSSVDEVSNSDSSILNEILDKYVSWLLLNDDVDDLNYERKLALVIRIITTISRIVFVKPEIAKKAIEIYLKCIVDFNHPIAREVQQIKSGFINHYASLEKILSILRDLNSLPKYFGFVLKAAVKLHELTGDKQIHNIYKYSKQDVINQFRLSKQNYFLDNMLGTAQKANGENFQFLLKVLKNMLSLDFTSAEPGSANSHSFVITTYCLPKSNTVKSFRLNVIKSLVLAYDMDFLADHRKSILDLILDIPRMIFATERNEAPFRHEEEINSVLNFLEQKANNFGIAAQKETFESLYWYVQWNIGEQFISQIERIKGLMEPKTLAEELVRTFRNSEIVLRDSNDIKKEFESKISELIKDDNYDEIANALYEFLSDQEYPPFHFHDFLRLLINKSPGHGLRFHDLLLEKRDRLYYQYASSILSITYFEMKEGMEYWNRIQKLESFNNSGFDNVILSIYGARVPGAVILTERDIELILNIVNKKDPENNFQLASALQSLISVEYPDVYSIISDYLERANQGDADMFFLRLSDNKIASADLVKNLVIRHSIPFYLTHQIERILIKVLNDFGADVIFDYLIARYYYKKKYVETHRTILDYEFVPNGDRSRLFNGREDVHEGLFFRSLDWYLEEDDEGGHLYYGKDIFEYLQPANSVSDHIYDKYNKILDTYAHDVIKLARIAESLEVFHTKNSNLVSLVLKGYSFVLDFEESDDNIEALKDAHFKFYQALTSMGVKSGTAGQPFQVDLELRDLLVSELKKIPEHMESRSIVVSALNSINNEINRSDFENETW